MSLKNMFENTESDAPARRLKVRFSEAADSGALVDFYKQNRHQHVDDRPSEKIAATANAGRTFMITDEKDDIAAASCAYDYPHPLDDSGETHWTEIGSTRAQLSGLGVYPFIIASQVIYDFLSSPPKDHFFASIYNDNLPVADFLENKVGWDRFVPDDDLIDASGERASLDKLVWLKAESHTLPHQARLVLEFMDKAGGEGIINKKTGERTCFDFSQFPLANRFRAAVETLATGDFANAIEAAPPIGKKELRERLTAHQNRPINNDQPRFE
jgi:hypothetical protein